jgi:hypothetical protein
MDSIPVYKIIDTLDNKKIKLRYGEERALKDKSETDINIYLDTFIMKGKNIPLINVGNYIIVEKLKKLDPAAKLYLRNVKYLKITNVDITRLIGFYHFGLSVDMIKPFDEIFISLQLGSLEPNEMLDSLTNEREINWKYLNWWLEQDYIHDSYKNTIYDDIRLLIRLKTQ